MSSLKPKEITPPKTGTMEYEKAVKAANCFLDETVLCPDSNLIILSRQFLLAIERVEIAESETSLAVQEALRVQREVSGQYYFEKLNKIFKMINTDKTAENRVSDLIDFIENEFEMANGVSRIQSLPGNK